MNINGINDCFADEALALRLPQFVIDAPPTMFEELGKMPLTKELLLEGFTLQDKDALIDFSAVDSEIAKVDLDDRSGATPKILQVKGTDKEMFRAWFDSLSFEQRVQNGKTIILKVLEKMDSVSNKDLSDYVTRVMAGLSTAQLEDLQQAPHNYALKIKRKIESLMETHREKKFNLWANQSKITVEGLYKFSNIITPIQTMTAFPNSLYRAEEDMNGWERDVAYQISGLRNIKWWHRNISRQGFYINGYVQNHYPDIIVMTKSGKILLIEPKGDFLVDNEDSRQKAKLGEAWEKIAGSNYRYFMVAKEKKVSGAYTFDEFINIIKVL